MQSYVKGLWKISSFNDKTDCARSFQSTHSLFSSGSFLLAFYVIFLGKCQRYQGQKHQHGTPSTSSPGFSIEKSPDVACLDASKVSFPLTVRPWQEGDRFTPFGMKGSKLVSDYLTDRKKNYFERRRQLVVEDAKGTIVWLVGERTSEKCRVSAETEKVVRVTNSGFACL